jgi:serine/threonine-protein kinase
MDRAEPVHDVALGEVIGGYRLERLLGAGSTSKVFFGSHVLLGRTAAVKVLAPALVSNKDVVARLLTEARVVNDIRHPNIIDVMDFVVTESPPRVALIMEVIEGPSLKAMRESPLSYEQALGVAMQLVDAVSAAHKTGVIHRDIKPDNLLLTTDPRKSDDKRKIPSLKIVDFGIAKLAGSGGKTVTGMMLGTPAYMAPEQVAGRPPPSAATDVFAIGEVLYEILAGERAYPAVAIHETVRAKLRGELPDLKLPPIPGDTVLLEMIKRCLALKPQDRPALEELKAMLVELSPLAENFTSDASSRRVSRAAPQAPVPAKIEPVRSRSTPGKPILPPNEATSDVAVFRAAQAAKAAPIASNDVTSENPVIHTTLGRDEITDRNERTDPLSKMAQVVLDHSQTDLEISQARVAVAIAKNLPPPAATELMASRPTERGDVMHRRIPNIDSSPTNVAMDGLTMALSAHPAIETNDDAPGTEVTQLGTRARRGLLAPAGVNNDMPETQLALPSVTASEMIHLEADTAEIPDGIDALHSQESLMKETLEVEPVSDPYADSSDQYATQFPEERVSPPPRDESIPQMPISMSSRDNPQARDVLLASRDLGSTSRDRDPPPYSPPPAVRDLVHASRLDPASSVAQMQPRVVRKRRWLAVSIGVLWFIAAGLLIFSLVLRRDRDRQNVTDAQQQQIEAPVAEQIKVSVNSKPIGARVEVAATGEYLGNTPVVLSFVKENVPKALRISSPGYDTVTIAIAASNSVVSADLEPSQP